MGYYNHLDLTKETIDEEGWFHTGDIGIIEDGKFLKITDRKKEIFKTSGGKYITPQMIENKLKETEEELEELKLRAPIEGGPLYQEALERFNLFYDMQSTRSIV